MAGIKYDSDKTRYDLIPAEALEAVARVFTYGSNKYADRNWEQGLTYSRLFGAMMRHMWAWWRGENEDKESAMSHLWHAGCCVFMLISLEIREMSIDYDDRQKVICTASIDALGVVKPDRALAAKKHATIKSKVEK